MTQTTTAPIASSPPITIESLQALGYVAENQVVAVKDFGEGMYAAIVPRVFTWRIIYGWIDDRLGVERFWCYERVGDAIVALREWTDDRSEPAGWAKAYDGRRHGEPRKGAAL